MVDPTNFRIGAVTALPEPVAQHDDVAAIGAVFLGRKGATCYHRCAEHREIVCGDMNAQHLLRMVAAGYVESGSAKIVSGYLLEDACLLAPETEVRYAGYRECPLRACIASARPIPRDLDR